MQPPAPERQTSLGTNVNDHKARDFQKIATAGWANLSDGDVNTSPIGHIALIHIEPRELNELLDAVFSDEPFGNKVQHYPGTYVLVEDSDGNATLTEHLTLDVALNYYNHLQALNNGKQVDRADMPLHLQVKSAADQAFAKIVAMERHYYLAPAKDGDVTRRLCGATDGLVRMDRSNVNCVTCLGVLDNMIESEEKLYLVHLCGEAFDDMKIALAHVENCEKDYLGDNEWSILPESEAM